MQSNFRKFTNFHCLSPQRVYAVVQRRASPHEMLCLSVGGLGLPKEDLRIVA
jgi:hypothetical protein